MVLLLVAIQVVLVGNYITVCNLKERLFMAGTTMLLWTYLYRGNNLSILGPVALGAFLLFTAAQYIKAAKASKAIAART